MKELYCNGATPCTAMLDTFTALSIKVLHLLKFDCMKLATIDCCCFSQRLSFRLASWLSFRNTNLNHDTFKTQIHSICLGCPCLRRNRNTCLRARWYPRQNRWGQKSDHCICSSGKFVLFFRISKGTERLPAAFATNVGSKFSIGLRSGYKATRQQGIRTSEWPSRRFPREHQWRYVRLRAITNLLVVWSNYKNASNNESSLAPYCVTECIAFLTSFPLLLKWRLRLWAR